MELGIYRSRRVALIPATENLVRQLVLDGGFGRRIQRDFEPEYPASSEILRAVQEMSDQLDEMETLVTS